MDSMLYKDGHEKRSVIVRFLPEKPVLHFFMFTLDIEVPIDDLLNPLPQFIKHSPK